MQQITRAIYLAETANEIATIEIEAFKVGLFAVSAPPCRSTLLEKSPLATTVARHYSPVLLDS